jgi:histone-lysine N-methyltransferase SETMAR
MAVPLAVCTVEEQRANIRFLWSEGVKPLEIYRRMLQKYGDACIDESRVYEWVDAFKNGRTSIRDYKRSGRPSTAITDEKVGRSDAIISENGSISLKVLARELDVSIGSAHSIVTEVPKYHKLCARWVPRMLTDDHKMNRVQTSTASLARYNDEGEDFLARIVTGDLTWVHRYEPESKRQSLEWRHTSSPAKKKFKPYPSAGKVLFTLFWDMNGPFFHYGIKKLVQRCEKCIEKKGDYVEK